MSRPAPFGDGGRGVSRRVDESAAPIAGRLEIEGDLLDLGRSIGQIVLGLRETGFGGNPHGGFGTVDPFARIDQDHRSGGHGVVRSRDSHHLGGVRHGTRLPGAARIPGVVTIVDTHASPIGSRRPKVLVEHAVAVHIVPAGIEQPTIGQKTWCPLVCLVEGDRMGVLPVRSHARQGEYGAGTEAAAVVPTASCRGENNVAAVQIDREEVIVTVRGKPPGLTARKRSLVDVVMDLHPFRRTEARKTGAAGIASGGRFGNRGVGEKHARGVRREFRIEETSGGEIRRRHIPRPHSLFRIIQNKESPTGTRTVPETLRELVAHRAGHELGEEKRLTRNPLKRIGTERRVERMPFVLVPRLFGRVGQPRLAETFAERYNCLRESPRFPGRTDTVLHPPIPVDERVLNRLVQRRGTLHRTRIVRCPFRGKGAVRNEDTGRVHPLAERYAVQPPITADRAHPPPFLRRESHQQQLRVPVFVEPQARHGAGGGPYRLITEGHLHGNGRETVRAAEHLTQRPHRVGIIRLVATPGKVIKIQKLGTALPDRQRKGAGALGRHGHVRAAKGDGNGHREAFREIERTPRTVFVGNGILAAAERGRNGRLEIGVGKMVGERIERRHPRDTLGMARGEGERTCATHRPAAEKDAPDPPLPFQQRDQVEHIRFRRWAHPRGLGAVVGRDEEHTALGGDIAGGLALAARLRGELRPIRTVSVQRDQNVAAIGWERSPIRRLNHHIPLFSTVARCEEGTVLWRGENSSRRKKNEIEQLPPPHIWPPLPCSPVNKPSLTHHPEASQREHPSCPPAVTRSWIPGNDMVISYMSCLRLSMVKRCLEV